MPELKITYRGVVSAWQCDHMGHLNVAYYVSKFDEASWQFFAMLGFAREYLKQHKCALAGVQQNITYKKELYPGDVVTIRSGLLKWGSRSMRFVHEMRNDANGEVVAVMDITAVMLDAESRKSRPLPDKVPDTSLLVEYDFSR